MPKVATLSVVDNYSDAAFRLWITELRDMLVAAGFVQTDDTGQLDVATVVRPGTTSTAAGYMIFRTNDGFSPVFVKIEPGVFNNQARAATWMTFGTGTNGAGTITGLISTRFTNTMVESGGARSSRACTGNGFHWICFKDNCTGNDTYSLCSFAILRFCDETGAPNDSGFIVYVDAAGALNAFQVRHAGPFMSGNTFSYAYIVGDVSSANVGADIQFWPHFVAQPRLAVNPFAATCDRDLVPAGTERELTTAPGVTMNFINAGHTGFNTAAVYGAAKHTIMLPWVD